MSSAPPGGDLVGPRARRAACAAGLVGLALLWALLGFAPAQVDLALAARREGRPPSPVDATLPDYARLCREAARLLPEDAVVGLVLPAERPSLELASYWEVARYLLAPRRVLALQPADPLVAQPLPAAGWLLIYRGRVRLGETVLDLMPVGTLARAEARGAGAPR